MFVAITRSVRLALAAAHVLDAVVRVMVLFPWFTAATRRRHIAAWSQKALRIFGIRTANSSPPCEGSGARLVVANHVSWLDVFAIWSTTDATFVAKGEVGRWPIIGSLAQRLGVIFIDRSRRRDAMMTSRHMADLLAQGRSVCIFPEGTSTNGRELQPFHPALFQSAIEAGVAVQPIAIRYFRANGALATEVAFTGDMSLVQSMWRLAGTDQIIIDVGHLPFFDTTGLDRRIAVERAHALIGQRLREPAGERPMQPIESAATARKVIPVTSSELAVS